VLPYDGKIAIGATAATAGTDTSWARDFVNQVLAQSADRGASVIHIEPYKESFRIRMRVDGLMVEPYDRFPIAFAPFVVRRIKNMSGMDISNSREGLDGRLKIQYRGRSIDFRIATMPVNSDPSLVLETCVLRILDVNSAPQTLDQVIPMERQVLQLRRLLTSDSGIILATGPTGCGKSTTLYSLLTELNTPEVNILTIEDPVERVIPGANQTQVIAPNTFAKSLRMALRSDPDIILVGEIRDDETATLAIKAAQTGHLVLSSIHANGALSTVSRLNNLGIKYADIASALIAATAQRLVRRLCPSCRLKERLSPELEHLFSTHTLSSDLIREGYAYTSVGCPYCTGLGYKGRVALMEVLEFNDSLRTEMLSPSFSPVRLKELALTDNFRDLFYSGLEAVSTGLTDLKEIRAHLSANG
jgi:type II secretory ATPase GspE/PulE/Tfp pilus assembly ATPase PilB-like protein